METVFNYIFFAAIAVIVGSYAWYVSIMQRRNKALEALSSIDIHTKQRFDLIPNLIKMAERYMEHEKSLFKEITELRSSVQKQYSLKDPSQVKEHLKEISMLEGKISQFMVSVENYPALKSDTQMLSAMQSFQEIEGHIAAARRFYNASVTELNNSVQIFPGSYIANIAGIQSMPFFEAPIHETKGIDANDFMRR